MVQDILERPQTSIETEQKPKNRWLNWVVEESASEDVTLPWSRTTRSSRAPRLVQMKAGFSR